MAEGVRFLAQRGGGSVDGDTVVYRETVIGAVVDAEIDLVSLVALNVFEILDEHRLDELVRKVSSKSSPTTSGPLAQVHALY